MVVDVRFENWGISLSRVIFSDITQFQLGEIGSHAGLRPIMCQPKYFMEHKLSHQTKEMTKKNHTNKGDQKGDNKHAIKRNLKQFPIQALIHKEILQNSIRMALNLFFSNLFSYITVYIEAQRLQSSPGDQQRQQHRENMPSTFKKNSVTKIESYYHKCLVYGYHVKYLTQK